MSDDRDLDELLESLEQLLREGESHNDDADETTAASPAASKPAAKPAKPAKGSEKRTAPVAPARKAVKEPPAKREDRGAVGEAKIEATTTQEELPHFVVEETQESGEPPAEPSPSAGEVLPDEAVSEAAPESVEAQTGEGEAPQPVHRVVLTEEMLVDNHQASLPLGEQRPDAQATPSPEQAGQEQPLRDADLERLVAEVYRDVNAQLQAQLPIWIGQAVRRHLGPQQTSTDQKKEQDK